MKIANKRMLSDWLSAALQTSRKCGRWYDCHCQVKHTDPCLTLSHNLLTRIRES